MGACGMGVKVVVNVGSKQGYTRQVFELNCAHANRWIIWVYDRPTHCNERDLKPRSANKAMHT